MRSDIADHIKQRDLSVPRKRGIGGAHVDDAIRRGLAGLAGMNSHFPNKNLYLEKNIKKEKVKLEQLKA